VREREWERERGRRRVGDAGSLGVYISQLLPTSLILEKTTKNNNKNNNEAAFFAPFNVAIPIIASSRKGGE